MNTPAVSDIISDADTIRRFGVEYDAGVSPRKFVQDFRPDVLFCFIFPTQCAIHMATGGAKIELYYGAPDEEKQKHAMIDMLVGLDYWQSSSEVPAEICTPVAEDSNLCYVIMKTADTRETVFKKMQPRAVNI